MRVILPDGRSVDGSEHGSKIVDPLNGGVPPSHLHAVLVNDRSVQAFGMLCSSCLEGPPDALALRFDAEASRLRTEAARVQRAADDALLEGDGVAAWRLGISAAWAYWTSAHLLAAGEQAAEGNLWRPSVWRLRHANAVLT